MEKKIQLFLLPFAGGNANSYNKLISCLDESIDAVSVEYAGRGERRKEDFILEYELFLEDAASFIMSKRNKALPYAILGYSLGSALVYDIVRTASLDRAPQLMIICARGFLANQFKSQKYASLGEEEFIEKVRQLGGFDERILQNRRFLNIFLEPLKADYGIWSQYRYLPLSQKIDSDMLIFYSEADSPRETVEGWRDITTGQVQMYEFGHNHFFINEHYADMANIINDNLI